MDRLVEQNPGPAPCTQLARITGRPAMSVPLHRTADGLPLGVRFVGPLGAEGRMLALAAQLEAARPWFDRVPPTSRRCESSPSMRTEMAHWPDKWHPVSVTGALAMRLVARRHVDLQRVSSAICRAAR